MKLKKAKFIKTKKSIKANVFDFRKDEVVWVNNKKLIRDYIKHNGVTSIVPIFEKKNIILLRQYRYGSDEIMYEVPAGTIDTGEKPISCAKRELREEKATSNLLRQLTSSSWTWQQRRPLHRPCRRRATRPTSDRSRGRGPRAASKRFRKMCSVV